MTGPPTDGYASLPAGPSPNPFVGGPVHVPSLTSAARVALLGHLAPWVDTLAHRFALDVRTLPPCWDRHNGMVEVLAGLRDYERGAFVGTAPPTAAIDWLRALRDALAFLRDLGALTQCTAREHRPDPERPTLEPPGV